MKRFASASWCTAVSCLVVITGCGPAPVDEPRGAAPPPVTYDSGRASSSSPRERQAAFLNRIRQSDPQFGVIERAVFNERNELGLIVDRTVRMDAIPALMKSLLTQMAREFPGEDLTIIAYAPTQPPMRLGVGRLDARTRQMTYTSDQPTNN